MILDVEEEVAADYAVAGLGDSLGDQCQKHKH